MLFGEAHMPSNGATSTGKINLWTQMNQREAWLYCVIMFVAFWIVLVIAGVLSNMYGSEGIGPFYILAGFFLGVSEVMYWIQRSLKSQPETPPAVPERAE
jgi:hypothetical protein